MIAVAYLGAIVLAAGVALYLSTVELRCDEMPVRQDKSRIPFVAWVPDK